MAGRNIGIFAHVDAGKTTLSEQMLLLTGTIRQAGSVDRGTAHTDDLPVERRRGISVKSACAVMQWQGTEIRLIDTPGHTDFSAEIERSMWALDAAVMVVDAHQGVQPQTETLCRALLEQGLPFLFFLNKTDREGADPDRTMAQIRRRLGVETVPLWNEEEAEEYACGSDDELMERYLEGEHISREEMSGQMARMTRTGAVHPALKGSALKGDGVRELMDAIVALLPEAEARGEELCGVAFAEARDRMMGRGLWVRLFSGSMESRMPVELDAGVDRRTGEKRTVQRKITQIRDAAGNDTGRLKAGETGVLFGLGEAEIGTVFGRGDLLPRTVRPGHLRTPLITVRVQAEDPGEEQELRKACRELGLEDPMLRVRYEKSTGEMHMHMMGKVQIEILQEELETRFGLKARFSEPTIIYRETIRQRATGFVAYTMPKPCWAVLEFDIEPGERGSGVQYTSAVQGRDILPRYQHQVEQALPQALSQGRLGWQVTDVKITLTGGNHHLIHTHPLDFIVATPMGIQDGLRRGGSVLLEPILEARFVMPAETAGRVISDVQMMRGEVTDTVSDGENTAVTALIPAAESLDYPTAFASLTGGRGSMSTRLHSWRDCPPGKGATAPHRGVDPLDTAKYILAARSALEGDIYD